MKNDSDLRRPITPGDIETTRLLNMDDEQLGQLAPADALNADELKMLGLGGDRDREQLRRYAVRLLVRALRELGTAVASDMVLLLNDGALIVFGLSPGSPYVLEQLLATVPPPQVIGADDEFPDAGTLITPLHGASPFSAAAFRLMMMAWTGDRRLRTCNAYLRKDDLATCNKFFISERSGQRGHPGDFCSEECARRQRVINK